MTFYSHILYHKFALMTVMWALCWHGSVGGQTTAVEHAVEPTTQPRVHSVTSKNIDNAADKIPQQGSELTLQQPVQQTGILNLDCVGIRIRRYVSNGFCTSRRPIRDMICEGQCVPMDELPWFPDYSKVSKKRVWRCVQDDVRRKKVKVFCNDGSQRKYRVLVVRSCKCKRYTRQQNLSNPNPSQ